MILSNGAISGGVFFAVTAGAVALLIGVIHMQTTGHSGSLGAVYRNEASIDGVRAQLHDISGQLEDIRRRLRVLAGEDIPGDLPLPRLPGVPPIPRRNQVGGLRN